MSTPETENAWPEQTFRPSWGEIKSVSCTGVKKAIKELQRLGLQALTSVKCSTAYIWRNRKGIEADAEGICH